MKEAPYVNLEQEAMAKEGTSEAPHVKVTKKIMTRRDEGGTTCECNEGGDE